MAFLENQVPKIRTSPNHWQFPEGWAASTLTLCPSPAIFGCPWLCVLELARRGGSGPYQEHSPTNVKGLVVGSPHREARCRFPAAPRVTSKQLTAGCGAGLCIIQGTNFPRSSQW